MERLFVMDLKNYDESWTRSRRPSVRGIIVRNGKLAMVHSLKYDYYKFPGGGIDENETMEEALIREVKEETGLLVIPDSIIEYGSVLRLQKSNYNENAIFEQENYYYRCEVHQEVGKQELDGYEEEDQFVLEFVDAKTAISANRNPNPKKNAQEMLEREAMVLEKLISDGIIPR